MSGRVEFQDAHAPLLGTRILVVEDDFLLATELCQNLSDLGATVLGPAPTPFYALSMLSRRGVDVAVLDIRLHGATVFEVADELMARNTPIVFATASSAEEVPGIYRGFPLLQKPFTARSLYLELTKALSLSKASVTHIGRHPKSKSYDNQLVRTILRAMQS